jgi:hypothetical protein
MRQTARTAEFFTHHRRRRDNYHVFHRRLILTQRKSLALTFQTEEFSFSSFLLCHCRHATTITTTTERDKESFSRREGGGKSLRERWMEISWLSEDARSSFTPSPRYLSYPFFVRERERESQRRRENLIFLRFIIFFAIFCESGMKRKKLLLALCAPFSAFS